MVFVFRRRAVRRIALAAAVFACAPVAAQDAAAPPDAAPDGGPVLDPDSPLTPLSDLGVDWPDLAAPEAPPPESAAARPATVEAAAEQRYAVALGGLDGLETVSFATLRDRFDALSTLQQDAGKPANVAQIDRRARADEAMLRDLLRAYGYYDAAVAARVEAGATGAIKVTLEAEPGPVYRLAGVEAPGIANAGAKADTLREAYGVAPGAPVDAERILAAETALRAKLGREGFPFARVGETEVVVDHETHTAVLRLAVDPGGPAKFGAIAVAGAPIFSARHIGRIARFRPGDPYDAAMIDDLRRALIQTSLVSSVTLTPRPAATPGTVDIAVALEPAPPRTIAGELGYGAGEGVRTAISWQHRNLIPPEGAVTFSGVLGTQEQSLGALLRRSNFKARDRVLTAQVVASHTDRAAFDARTFTIGGGLERQTNIIWQKKWTWSAGGELVASDERDVVGQTNIPRRRTFFITALPGSLAYDGTDDLLDPTRGFRLAGRVSPEASFQGSAFFYVKSQIDASVYVPASDRVTLGARTRLGSIAGASRDRLAPSRRFYAGGGGSVRGYGYQAIGPRDANNDPVGGRSLAEFSIEGRVRFGDFGVVPFLDGGNLYTQALPRFTGLRYGAGIGARYYTSFGPIRVDVGAPLNRRAGDSRVTVYVSLGQAF